MGNGNVPVWIEVQVYWILDQIYILFNILCFQDINSGKFLG